MDCSEIESEEDESMTSSVVPQRSRMSKKSEIIINSVPSVQNNAHSSSLNIRQTNMNINYSCKIGRKNMKLAIGTNLRSFLVFSKLDL